MGFFSDLFGTATPSDEFLDPRVAAAVLGGSREDIKKITKVQSKLLALLAPDETLSLVAADVVEKNVLAITERRAVWHFGYSYVTLPAEKAGQCSLHRMRMASGSSTYRYTARVTWGGPPPHMDGGAREWGADSLSLHRWDYGEAGRIMFALQGLRDGWLPDAQTVRPGRLYPDGYSAILAASGAELTDGNLLRLAERVGDVVGAQVVEYLGRSSDEAGFRDFLAKFEGDHDPGVTLALADSIIDWLWSVRPIYRKRLNRSLVDLQNGLREPGLLGSDNQVQSWFAGEPGPRFGPLWRASFQVQQQEQQ